MYIVNGEHADVQNFIVGAGGVTKGDFVVGPSTAIVKGAGGVTAATAIGIALETGAQNAVVPVMIFDGRSIVRAPYTGASLTALTDAKLGTVFDLDDETTVDLDDTDGGCAVCVGYDNNACTIDFKIPASFRLL